MRSAQRSVWEEILCLKYLRTPTESPKVEYQLNSS